MKAHQEGIRDIRIIEGGIEVLEETIGIAEGHIKTLTILMVTMTIMEVTIWMTFRTTMAPILDHRGLMRYQTKLSCYEVCLTASSKLM